MRLSPIPALALTFTLATSAFAGDTAKQSGGPRVVCANNTKDGSRLVQGTDLVIEPGEKVKDAVAVEGNVIIRKGAVVEDAIAVRGRVIVEAGGTVKGDAVSLGGEVRVHSGGHVDGDAVALGGRLNLTRDDDVKGDKVSLSFEIGGKDLVRGFIEEALDEEMRCHIIDDVDKDV
jgi:NDP-sugar pyrophosphorylase family protein